MMTITPERRGSLTIYHVSVHGADYGRICGKQGGNLAALNTLVQSCNEQCRVVLDDALTEDRTEDRTRNRELDPAWNPAPVLDLVRAWHTAAGAPGTVEVSGEPRGEGTYDIFLSETPPPDVLNALAKWASVAARGLGGKVHIEGAHYATL